MLSGFLFEFSFHNLTEGGSLAAPAYPVHALRRLQVMEAMAPAEMDQDHRQKNTVQDQIRAKEQEIRELREEIKAKEEEVRELREEIRGVEKEMAIASGTEVRKPLQAKLEFLRQQLISLRQEIGSRDQQIISLRQEISSVRSVQEAAALSSDLGTEYDWLGQKVVPPAPSSGAGGYPSSTRHERMWLPVRVEHWDVMNEIEEFIRSADRRKRVYKIALSWYIQNTERADKQENHLMNLILLEMLAFMKKKEPQSNFVLKTEFIILSKSKGGNDGIGSGEGASSSAMVDVYSGSPRADFLIILGEKNILVVEVKNAGLGSDQDEPWYLHQVWTDCSCNSGEGNCWCADHGIAAAHGERIIRCISQLYEYMVLCKVGYGVLTDVRNWYLFKRDIAGCLKISAGIKASGEPPRVLAALSYLVHIASVDNSEFGDPTGNGQFPVVHGAAPSEHSSESTDDDINDRTYSARVSQNISSSERRRSERHRSGGAQLSLEDVSAEDLNLKKAGGIISSEGWSGCVVNGRLHGQPVALKFAHLGTERAEALLKEVVAYTKMEKLWGVFVPRLIGYGTTNNGRVVFLATELVEGVELGKVAVTREVETAALVALTAVHACGLLHGDVSSSNIMVVWGKEPTVRILDFGFSCITSNKKLQEAERVRLTRLFPHMVE